jgi:hypothetical protein
MIGGVPSGGGASSVERHPFVVLELGGGEVQDKTIWSTPWAWMSATPKLSISATIATYFIGSSSRCVRQRFLVRGARCTAEPQLSKSICWKKDKGAANAPVRATPRLGRKHVPKEYLSICMFLHMQASAGGKILNSTHQPRSVIHHTKHFEAKPPGNPNRINTGQKGFRQNARKGLNLLGWNFGFRWFAG